jgi:hypothetical protein
MKLIREGKKFYVSLRETEKRRLIGIKNPTNLHQLHPHIMLHEITIAAELIELLVDFKQFLEDLEMETRKLFEEHFVKNDVHLTFSGYNIMGNTRIKYLVALYKIRDETVITLFRNAFYEKFLELANKQIQLDNPTKHFDDVLIARHKLMRINDIPALYFLENKFRTNAYTSFMTLGSLPDFLFENPTKFHEIIITEINSYGSERYFINYCNCCPNTWLKYLDKFRPISVSVKNLNDRELSFL